MNYPDPPPHPDSDRLEAVTVCVGYGDFLAQTLPLNIALFDRWVVVTTANDHETREVCRRYGVQCILSDDHKRHGHTFNKGRLVERGLHHLSATGWRLHLDADVALPTRLRHYLRSAELRRDTLYGVDRAMVRTWCEWRKLLDSGYLHHQHDSHCQVRFPPGLSVGTRWASEATGYAPIGFFQLWHSDSDYWRGVRTRPYPDRHNDSARSDVQFAMLFDRQHRQLIPEVVAVHLESEPAKLGANWCGRTTKRFQPEK